VEDRILVLNVLRGLSDRYAHLRTWITRQRPFPTFLEVRDDLVMEELTQGLQPGSTASPGASSTALAATPPRQSAPRTAAPPPSSLLGPPPSGPSGGGRGGRRRRGGGRGGGRGAPTQAPVPGGPQGGHHGPLSRTRGLGASPCGPTTPPGPTRVHRWPCSPEHLPASSLLRRLLRRGFLPPDLPGLHRGLRAGIRRPWLARSAPWA
jgi:hypothetical protein